MTTSADSGPVGLTIQDVRNHINDDPDSNYLIGEEEFTEEQIKLAIELAFKSFNETPPILTGYNENNLPGYLKDTILLGVLARLYRGAALSQERNRLAYSDGGINVNVSDRAQFYMTVSQNFQQEFETKTTRWKHWQNINGAFGSITSDYYQGYENE